MLLGHNGSGKTTLLNLISMVLRSDFSALREERFEIEFELSNDHGRLIGEIKNDPTSHDDTIISEFDLLGTNLGEFYGLPPTGKEFRVPIIAVFFFDGPDIVNERIYFDSASLVAQIGRPELLAPAGAG